MRANLVGAAVIGFAALWAAGCSDQRCNIENCTAMVQSCRVEFAATANSGACSRAATVPEGFDFTSYCVEACNRQGSGETAECVANLAPQCDAAAPQDRASVVQEQCTGSDSSVIPHEPDPACVDECQRQRTSCEDACANPDFKTCMDCADGCAHAWYDCDQGC